MDLPLTGLVTTAITAAALCVGAVVGSFLNVCIYRMPREGLSVRHPARSFCPQCGHVIAWYDNVPIVSWFLLCGQCRSCRAPISLRYPLVEAMTAVLFAVIVHRYHVELGGGLGASAVLLCLGSAMIVAALIDFDLRILPDEITVGGMHLLPVVMVLFPELHSRHPDSSVARCLLWLGEVFAPATTLIRGALESRAVFVLCLVLVLAALFVAGSLVYRGWRRVFLPEEPRRWRDVSLAGVITASSGAVLFTVLACPELTLSPPIYSLAAALLGMLSGSGSIYLVGAIGTKVFRKPAMGFGDVKLMGLLGGFAGWWGALAAFFIACILGSVLGVLRLLVSRDRYLPFGPFLAFGSFLLVLWPGTFLALLDWYLRLFSAI